MSSKSSDQTRTLILEATWRLLESETGSKTRMADIAKQAGVSRQAVYLHFPNRAELLIATTSYIDEVEDVAGKMAAISKAFGGEQRLHAFVQAWGNYIPKIYPVARTLIALKSSDEDAAAAWNDRMLGLENLCGSIIDDLHKEKILTTKLSRNEAKEIMWSLISVQYWELLTIEQGIKQKRYLAIVEKMLLNVLL